jgi:hypothetical protein
MTDDENIETVPEDEQARTATHEACHGVVALVLDIPVELLSIRRGEGYRGATLYGERNLPWPDLIADAAAPSQPPATREAIEKDIIASLAGPASARIVTISGRFPPDHDEEAIAEALVTLRRLDPALACRLEEAEAEPASPNASDEAKAQRAAWLLNGFDRNLAIAQRSYLSAVAGELVDRHRHAIHAVAAALLEKKVLTGAAVALLFSGSRCFCHEWIAPPEVTP